MFERLVLIYTAKQSFYTSSEETTLILLRKKDFDLFNYNRQLTKATNAAKMVTTTELTTSAIICCLLNFVDFGFSVFFGLVFLSKPEITKSIIQILLIFTKLRS